MEIHSKLLNAHILSTFTHVPKNATLLQMQLQIGTSFKRLSTIGTLMTFYGRVGNLVLGVVLDPLAAHFAKSLGKPMDCHQMALHDTGHKVLKVTRIAGEGVLLGAMTHKKMVKEQETICKCNLALRTSKL